MRLILLAIFMLNTAPALGDERRWIPSNLDVQFQVQNGPTVDLLSSEYSFFPLFSHGFTSAPTLALMGQDRSLRLSDALIHALPHQVLRTNSISPSQLKVETDRFLRDLKLVRSIPSKLSESQIRAWQALHEDGWDIGLANLKVTLKASSVFRELHSELTVHTGEGGDHQWTCQFGVQQMVTLEIVDIEWVDGRNSSVLRPLVGSLFRGIQLTHLDPVRTRATLRGEVDPKTIREFTDSCTQGSH